MKTKLTDFMQHLYHEIEDEDRAEEYLDNAIPYIGLIIMYFNSLESFLDSVLCESFTDRTDSTGLIVLNQMSFSSKVELLKRFCDNFQISLGKNLKDYDQLVNNLKESARLRNLVAHANWETTNEEGYTFVKLKMSKKGMHQEYVQFTEESLTKIIELIIKTKNNLYEFWEHRNDVLYERKHEELI
jgi:Icc-related predicted phosphoesterase